MRGNTATFSCTALVGTNKVGNLKKDEDGYYDVVLGALNFYNSNGALYRNDTSARELFKEGSSLMRRIAKAALRGEYGHPPRDGMQINAYVLRLMEIREDKVSHHIKEVRIDYTSVKDANGRPCIAIMGKVIPSGPYGAVLEKQFQNPKENVCFSVRAITDDIKIGMAVEKSIQDVVTWDYVNEPGISVANKYACPTLESFGDDVVVTEEVMNSILAIARSEQLESVGMEADSTVGRLEALKDKLGWNKPKPTYLRW